MSKMKVDRAPGLRVACRPVIWNVNIGLLLNNALLLGRAAVGC